MIAPLRRYIDRLNALYPDAVDRTHARLLALLALFSLVTTAAFAINYRFAGLTAFSPALTRLLIVIPFPAMVAVLWLLGAGRLEIARVSFTTYFFLVNGFVAIGLNILGFAGVLLLMSMLLGVALLGQRGVLLGLAGTILTIGGALLGEAVGWLPRQVLDDPQLVGGLSLLGAAVIVAALILWFLSGVVDRTINASRQHMRRLEIVGAAVSQMNAAFNKATLLSEVVDLIRDRTGYYHVQIFLLDDMRQNAVLVASTGDLGVQLLARDHQLPVGSRSVIGRVTDSGQMVYAADTTRSAVHRVNEVLRETSAEIAFPLLDGARVIGALDVQSKRSNAFSLDDIETLADLANQISAALSNRLLLEDAERQLERDQQQHAETRKRLEETERINRQLTRQAWEDFMTGGATVSGVTVDAGAFIPDADWSPALQNAVAQDRTVIAQGALTTMAVPLEIRGITLGALEVTLPEDTNLEDAQELLEAVANRVALALDNTRLFDEASSRAEQERKIGQIASQLQSTVEIEEMLKIAVQELQSAVGANRSAIRLRSMAAPVVSAADPAQA